MQNPEPDVTVSDAIELSDELKENGYIDGRVRLYDIETEGSYTADARTFFNRTLLTDALETNLIALRDTFTEGDARGTHVLYGPYGSGKSHHMVALYHALTSPDAAEEWAQSSVDGLDDAIPEGAIGMTVAMQHAQPDNLWDPFFDRLDYEPELSGGGYPDMETIGEALGDKTVGVFIDEIEDWFKSLDEERTAANRGFLQALMEAAALPDSNLHVVVSVLREESVVHDIIDREDPIEINLNESVDNSQVIRHRLFGGEDGVDEEIVHRVAEHYVEAYHDIDRLDVEDDLYDQIVANYPFHPRLIDAVEPYYQSNQNQATRGMVYLFSKLLLQLEDQVDLIIESDVDAIEFDDVYSKINSDRQNVTAADINQLDTEAFKHARRILNTVLLHSLDPSGNEGVSVPGIVKGVYRSGADASSIKLDLNELDGEAPHLHKLNGKYAIRTQENAHAIIRNAARHISEEQAKSMIADYIEDHFGDNTYAVGFTNDDIDDIPNDKQLKLIVLPSSDTPHNVIEDVIKKQNRGREWKNTFVFLETKENRLIESGFGIIEKARYIKGARQIAKDNSVSETIREQASTNRRDAERELIDKIERYYGNVIDCDDCIENSSDAYRMASSTFVGDGDENSSEDIINGATASSYELSTSVEKIIKQAFDRSGEITVQAIFDEHRRYTTHPVPTDCNAVIEAVREYIQGSDVLAYNDGDGYHVNDGAIRSETVLHRATDVETWDVEDVETYLREQFNEDTRRVQLNAVQQELKHRTDIFLTDENSVSDAASVLAETSQYVLLRGSTFLEEPVGDAYLWDITNAKDVAPEDVIERLNDRLEDGSVVNTASVLREIRTDEHIYLSGDRTTGVFEEAVNTLTGEDVRISDESGITSSVRRNGDDATDIKLVPTLSGDVADSIDEYITSLGKNTTFTVTDVQQEVDYEVAQRETQTYLLEQLGADTAPEFALYPSYSESPEDFETGTKFSTPKAGVEKFKYTGESVSDARREWHESPSGGAVVRGEVDLILPADTIGVGGIGDLDAVEDSEVSFEIKRGSDDQTVTKVLNRIPESAAHVSINIKLE